MVKMVDIGKKRTVHREATAEGMIRLKKTTLDAVMKGRIPKGDVLTVAKTAAIMAVKRTPEIIPLTHPIPITGVEVRFNREKEGFRVTVTVRSDGKTGVEMEALTGVAAALLTVWDMVKALEKDEGGQYPHICIERIMVLRKVKG
ncbi:MAG: cyclic pyranopterin monophosphate synthase MoaC [Candidatus Hadarchaeales archaeon]